VQFASQVLFRAERSVAAAKLHKGDQYAPYEYYGAAVYLDQAKHRAGMGDFQTSYRYGRKAEALADAAVKIAKTKREEERDTEVRPAPGTSSREEPERPRPRVRIVVE
jgi:hypothetical protein